jgi:hypothetical protein
MADFNAAEAAARLMALESAPGGAGIPGMAGTPGGPVQESPTMTAERILQLLAAGTLGAGSGILGYGGVATGNLPAALVGSAGLTAAGSGMANAFAPNIRDVAFDKRRMKMQGN